MVDILIVDVLEKIFIGGDAKRGRASPPFNVKGPVGLDFRKCADGALIGGDVAVASDSLPSATAHKNGNSCKERNVNLLHGEWCFLLIGCSRNQLWIQKCGRWIGRSVGRCY